MIWFEIFNFLTLDFFIRLMGVWRSQILPFCSINEFAPNANLVIFTDNLLMGCIFAIYVKLLQHALLIFTSIPQLKLLMAHHAFPISKLLGCYPCSNSKKRILWQSIPMKKCLWSNSLEIWKFLVLSIWVQLGNVLDTMRNSNLKKLL